MDSKLYMIVSEELAATATKMFETQQQARKYWIQSHRKIKRKAGQVGLDTPEGKCKSTPDGVQSIFL